jgi:hypothetical protein
LSLSNSSSGCESAWVEWVRFTTAFVPFIPPCFFLSELHTWISWDFPVSEWVCIPDSALCSIPIFQSTSEASLLFRFGFLNFHVPGWLRDPSSLPQGPKPITLFASLASGVSSLKDHVCCYRTGALPLHLNHQHRALHLVPWWLRPGRYWRKNVGIPIHLLRGVTCCCSVGNCFHKDWRSKGD